MKTAANPGGLPKEVFDGFQDLVASNRGQFYLDLGGAKAHYDSIVAFSQTDFTPDLVKITVPTLVMHGDDDQIVPFADSGPLTAKLVKNSTLKVYKGFPHGMCTTEAATINADLLAFIRS